ncbi:uncharacterized protein [Physcomitrium patens]|uniref:HhH-GPD domain-containing protein n=1 Tax=Physcomitrium patens TaxID=3218 RepID=A0A7I4B9E0_PHYPA|nr:endonuclease III-like protein 1 isoform X3 [Physcomitrium patens]|eukprot:XP_024400082.1 endonuclease III-like protein 1 isoform X3 [Physcomitrella patens]
MEDNAFAAFSFSAPAPPTSWNRTEKTVKVCALAPGSNLRLRLIQRRKLTAKVERFDAAATVGRLPCLVKTEPKLEIEDSDQAISGNIVKVESSSKAVKARQSRSKADNSTKECAPENWEQIVQGIRSMRMGKDAPVDLFGTHQLFDIEADKGTQQFQALVAAMISSQTRDAVTGAAMQRLRAMPGGLNVAHIASDDVEIDALAEILKPVGFYRQKAKFMKSIAQSLAAPPHNGAVPNSLEELMKLPGVGPKVALLVLWVAFGMGEEGLIVDTNVRRVCSRLGWVPADATPELTRRTLESWMPRSMWADTSFLFVGFGQQVCKPLAPKCEGCKVSQLCPSAFKQSPKRQTRKPK